CAGSIAALGGQTPLSLPARLQEAGVPALGTPPEAIDSAEDRGQFGQVLLEAGLNAPAFGTAISLQQAREIADQIGFPVLVRPSYVIGGRGMEIVYDDDHLIDYISRATESPADQATLPDTGLV